MSNDDRNVLFLLGGSWLWDICRMESQSALEMSVPLGDVCIRNHRRAALFGDDSEQTHQCAPEAECLPLQLQSVKCHESFQ